MFVEKGYKQIPSPAGAAGQIDPCRPYGLKSCCSFDSTNMTVLRTLYYWV